jgi:cation diffusion facilitator family transporter
MRSNLPTRVMQLSLAVAFLMLGGKLTAYYLTGSSAILADAAESVIHLAATTVAAFSLWYSRQPADAGHPYGHGKIAFFSAGLEGGLIFIAAGYIIWTAVAELIRGPELRRLGTGLLITGFLALINLALGLTLIRVGRRHGSFVVVANGKHVLTDMWTSLAVLVGVAVVWLTDVVWLDPVVAIAAGLQIIGSAVGLIRRAYGGLLDEADPLMTQRIVECLRNARERGRIDDFHQLRHREVDALLWIEVHMLLPSEMPVDEAHRRVTEVEHAITDLFPDKTVHLTTHIEPTSHVDHHPAGHPELPDPLDPAKDA